MTHRTSVALLALLLAPALPLGALAEGESAAGAKTRDGSCAGAYTRPTRANVSAAGSAVLCLVNRERRRNSLAPVRANAALNAVAARRAGGMVASGRFGDNSPSGQTALELIARSPYAWHSQALASGQDIAWGAGRYATPAATVASWMASPPHRQIILTGRFRDAGIGVVAAPPRGRRTHGATYVLELAARGR